MSKLISTPEAAALLGVHRVTVFIWLQEGKITAAGYVGGGERPRPVFDSDYIEALAAERAANTEAQQTTATVAA